MFNPAGPVPLPPVFLIDPPWRIPPGYSWAALLIALTWIGSIVLVSVYLMMEDENRMKLLQILKQAGIFAFLTAVILQVYPAIDGWLLTNAQPFYVFSDLAMHNRNGWGVIHMPTLLLGFLVAVAGILTPPAARWLERRANVGAAKLTAGRPAPAPADDRQPGAEWD